MNRFSFITVVSLLLSTLVGCASNAEQQRQLEMLADRRAGILASGLPIEYGPLSIIKATSNANVVTIEMIYNQSNTISVEQLMNSSTNYYCSNSEIVDTMKLGVNYQILIRNSRGQIISQEQINSTKCKTPEQSSSQ
jgi:hypothetical protein